jgi:hypothetical protein
MRLPDITTSVKSPFAAAVVLSLAVAAGAVLTTLGTANFGAVAGHPHVVAQAEERAAPPVGAPDATAAVTRDIDFVTSHIRASIKRSDDLALARFTQIDATIAALNDKIASLQGDRLVSAPAAGTPGENLRTSLHDIAAHGSAIAAITKRLDRIEVKVGMSTDEPPSAPVRHTARRKAPVAKAAEQPDLLAQTGMLFGLRPAAKPSKPLRVSTLRD